MVERETAEKEAWLPLLSDDTWGDAVKLVDKLDLPRPTNHLNSKVL